MEFGLAFTKILSHTEIFSKILYFYKTPVEHKTEQLKTTVEQLKNTSRTTVKT